MNSAPRRVTGWINVTSYVPKPYDETEGVTLSDVHVSQEFTGGLIGTGAARFLMVALADGSSHFMGIERFTGTLGDSTGSFLLRNSGVLKDGTVTSERLVIPGFGTGELSGLRGTGGVCTEDYFLDYWFE
jgi:uncharacterized protein DUF3224